MVIWTLYDDIWPMYGAVIWTKYGNDSETSQEKLPGSV